MRRPLLPTLLLAVTAILPALAQQQPPPPAAYTPTPAERAQLDQRKEQLAARLRGTKAEETTDAAVFLHTAELADRLRLYNNPGHVATVLRGLDLGLQRLELLAKGERPWTSQPGRSLRGYVSRIDGSVQPYAVVLPAGFDPRSRTPYRLDVVLHGRGPTEVTFLQQNEPAPGSSAAKAPEEPFIELHPFGRGNNGWRWAGETDVFEALEQVRKQYPIDPQRIVLRGFSMGGHGAWHIGLHHPDRWAAVSPGAGFADTRRYLKITEPVPPYQERAWHIYDPVDYALNLFNTPFVTYGGEKDPQLQASLIMREAAEKEGLKLQVIVGPDTEHRYHPESLREIMRQLATHQRRPDPREVRFTTWTLKYPRCQPVTLDALEEHYGRAVVTATRQEGTLRVTTQNVAALTLDPSPLDTRLLEIDGQRVQSSGGGGDSFHKVDGKWRRGRIGAEGPRKRHDLQGPIDDAFTGRFLAVSGTGTAWSTTAQAYADASLRRFQDEWRFGFRGEVPVKEDAAVTEADWKDANLVLFGDPGSNRLLARVVEKLPLSWTREGLRVNGKSYGPDALPVLVYPNPLNPRRYVVINSGHTWTRRDLTASNAYLTPKLPDWAVLKLAPGAGAEPPRAEVLAADYFDERWKYKAAR